MASPSEKQLEKLREIGAAEEGTYFALALTMNPYIKAGWVEQHPTAVNPKNKKEKATRLTDAGKALIAKPDEDNDDDDDDAEVAAFTIIDLAKPAQTRNLDNAAYKYPFADLKNGQAFFVPAKVDNKTNPSKAFASTLATANKRFAKADDFRHFSSRSMLGDPFGHKGVKGVGVFRDTVEEEAAAKKAWLEAN